jgi:hypothetical protein
MSLPSNPRSDASAMLANLAMCCRFRVQLTSFKRERPMRAIEGRAHSRKVLPSSSVRGMMAGCLAYPSVYQYAN